MTETYKREEQGLKQEQEQEQEKSPLYGAAKRNSKFAAAIALFLLIYIPSTFNWFSGKSVTTDILRDGALYEAYQTEALVVRNEELLYSASNGISIPVVNEGERVPGKSAVATVYGQMSFELMDELKQINSDLLREQYESLGRSAVFSQDVEIIEKDILGIIRKMIPEINHNSLNAALSRVKTINALVLKKAEAFSSLETDDPYVNLLKEDKVSIENEVAQTSSVVYSESPGHLSFVLDGNEPELSPDALETLSAERFDEILTSSEVSHPEFSNVKYGGLTVGEGEPFAKIVKDNSFYFVVKAPAEFVGRFSVGDRIRIQTETPYREFDGAEIVYINGAGEEGANIEDDENVENGNESGIANDGENNGDFADGVDAVAADARGDGLMAVRLSKYLFDFINVRTVNVALVEKYREGLKIPIKCLRDVDVRNGEAGVVLLKGSHASIRKVRLLATNDVYAIIESFDDKDPEGRVSRYDTYIRDTVNIEDGMLMSG